MIYLYLFGTCFHFIYVFMIIVNKNTDCYYLLDKLPPHLTILKANKRAKNRKKK